MTLTLAGGKALHQLPYGIQSSNILQEFLSAELEPGLSVEEACCPLCMYNTEGSIEPDELHRRTRLLLGAGLYYIEASLEHPGYVYLGTPHLFAKTFPQLAHAIPFIQQCQGVWLYANACPVNAPTLAIAACKTGRQ